jgi:hypothetical protein
VSSFFQREMYQIASRTIAIEYHTLKRTGNSASQRFGRFLP